MGEEEEEEEKKKMKEPRSSKPKGMETELKCGFMEF